MNFKKGNFMVDIVFLFGELMKGKCGFVMGVVNKNLIVWGIV